MTRVLTVLPAVPLPARSGLQLRMLEILQIVRALGCHSSVLAFETEDGAEGVGVLEKHCDDVRSGGRRVAYESFSVNQRVRQRLHFAWQVMRDHESAAYPLSVRYDAMGAAGVVAAAVHRAKPDFVVLPSFFAHYGPVVRRRGAATIIDAADVLTELTWSFFKHYGARNPLKAPGLFANYLGTRAQERLFLPQADEIWCTSAPEAAWFEAVAPDARVLVVPNAVPMASIAPEPLVASPIIGFIGTYGYAPNLDAALLLVDDVFPRVRERCPAAVVRLAGAGMPPTVSERLARTPGVEALGPVDDAGAFVAGCRAMAFPVRVRGGLPLKLVEAMAAQRPVVTTPEMAAGLPVQPGRDLLVGNTAADQARAIVELLANDDVAREIASNARQTFEREFTTEAVIERISTRTALGRAQPEEAL